MIGSWSEKTGTSVVEWTGGLKSTYVLAGVEPYVNRLGKEMSLRAWRGNCVKCGAEFVTKTPGHVAVEATEFSRRACDEHKAAKWFGVAKVSQ